MFLLLSIGLLIPTKAWSQNTTAQPAAEVLTFREIAQANPNDRFIYNRFDRIGLSFEEFQVAVWRLQYFLKNYPKAAGVLDNLNSDGTGPAGEDSAAALNALKTTPSAILAVKKLGVHGMIAKGAYVLAGRLYADMGLDTIENLPGLEGSEQDKWRQFLKMLKQSGVDTSSLENLTASRP